MIFPILRETVVSWLFFFFFRIFKDEGLGLLNLFEAPFTSGGELNFLSRSKYSQTHQIASKTSRKQTERDPKCGWNSKIHVLGHWLSLTSSGQPFPLPLWGFEVSSWASYSAFVSHFLSRSCCFQSRLHRYNSVFYSYRINQNGFIRSLQVLPNLKKNTGTVPPRIVTPRSYREYSNQRIEHISQCFKSGDFVDLIRKMIQENHFLIIPRKMRNIGFPVHFWSFRTR